MRPLRINKNTPVMMSRHIAIPFLIALIQLSYALAFGLSDQAKWDSVKSTVAPVMDPAFQGSFETPARIPVAAYGWEDGLHVSRDGLNLYALYAPADLVSWQTWFVNSLALEPPPPICNLFAGTPFIRTYAQTFGMDLQTNSFGCDSFLNIDILYAHRNSRSVPFTAWQLSSIARPGMVEGGPTPLFAGNRTDSLALFIFSGDGDCWIIRNTGLNPFGIENAIRLPSPLINPVAKEFTADNPMMERLHEGSDTLVLIYEKYTDAGDRTFMVSLSPDNALTWNTPLTVTTVSSIMGHIEHPHLFRDRTGQWWLYYSLDYAGIYRARQGVPGDWNSWTTPEKIIDRGNATVIGEPSVTTDGDIAFLLGCRNDAIDSTDVYDLDPWYVKCTSGSGNQSALPARLPQITIRPNPTSGSVRVVAGAVSVKSVTVTDISGRTVGKYQRPVIDLERMAPGLYLMNIETDRGVIVKRVLRY